PPYRAGPDDPLDQQGPGQCPHLHPLSSGFLREAPPHPRRGSFLGLRLSTARRELRGDAERARGLRLRLRTARAGRGRRAARRGTGVGLWLEQRRAQARRAGDGLDGLSAGRGVAGPGPGEARRGEGATQWLCHVTPPAWVELFAAAKLVPLGAWP